MNLKNCKKNQKLRVISVNGLNENLVARLFEIGFFEGAEIELLKVSMLKNTMLVQVLDSCFAIKSSIAELIEVEYV